MNTARWLLAWAVLAAGSAHAATPREITVDCDRGGDLARELRALASLSDRGPVTVHVVGTCRGPIGIELDDLTLRGVSPERSAIVGAPGAGTIVEAHGVRNLRLESLALRDGRRGVVLETADAVIAGCELARTDLALVIRGSSVSVRGTRIEDARAAIDARRSRLDVSFSTIDDIEDTGIAASEFSDVVLFKTPVASDSISVERSSLLVVTSELDTAVHARTYSHVSLAGSAREPSILRGAIFASNSEVHVFHQPVTGPVSVEGASWLTATAAELQGLVLERRAGALLTTSSVAGDVRASGFSTIELAGTTVAGELACRSGSDAVCEGAALGGSSGCESCRASEAARPVCRASEAGLP
jgi:hypothetical protein